MKTKCASLNNSSQNSCQVLGSGGWVVSEVDEGMGKRLPLAEGHSKWNNETTFAC